MPDRRRRRMGVLPSTLSARLVLVVVVTALVVFSMLATGAGVYLAYQLRTTAADDEVRRLGSVAQALDGQVSELDSHILAFVEWQTFWEQTSAPDQEFVSAEVDSWLPERAGVTALVWARSDGTIVRSYGDPADIEALRELEPRVPAAGVMRLPSGLAIVSARAIVGYPIRPSAGTLVVARLVTDEDIPGAAILLEPGDDPDSIVGTNGWKPARQLARYASTATRVADGRLATRGVMLGLDGSPAATLEISRSDPWFGAGRQWATIIPPIGLGLLTAALGLILGVMLSRSVSRPLRTLDSFMRAQGFRALHGLDLDEELEVDPGLPEDVRDLAQITVDLMTQLRINQAALIEAGEQTLQAERAFRTVVEESPEAKVLVRDGVVEIANPAATHLLGLRAGEPVVRAGHLTPESVSLFAKDGTPLGDLTPDGVGTEGVVVARCVVDDHPDRWIEIGITPVVESQTDYVVSARNITEERRVEALRQEIMSLVSHDLRSPVTVIRGYLDILERRLDSDAERTAVAGAQHAALRMEGLLDDLLNATKAERALAPTVMRPVDLGQVAASVVASLGVSTDRPIEGELAEGVVVRGDVARLEQAITNLIGNALKHGTSDGTVEVGVSALEGRARLTVRDDGPGIDPDIAESLFERGIRGERSSGVPGLGLGLYIVRIVAESHGGVVALESHDGPGAWFVIDLPLEAAADDG